MDRKTWLARAESHRARVEQWTRPRLERSARAEPHPVEDFLFDYYSFRPSQLARWHPGADVVLEDAPEFVALPGYCRVADGVTADVRAVGKKRSSFLAWLGPMLRATTSRAPQTGCFGLHEWAMVYRCDSVRHAAWPMRLGPDAIARVVEQSGLRCTHFDAFRFFTDAARPRNAQALTRESSAAWEQPGCLHANMDLYKWAYKLVPLTPSELVADAFALAWDIRVVDMRASPYDFASLGLEPIRIETADGRAEFEHHQRTFARRAEPIRLRLLATVEGATNPESLPSPGAERERT